jgi:hypothetical protein
MRVMKNADHILLTLLLQSISLRSLLHYTASREKQFHIKGKVIKLGVFPMGKCMLPFAAMFVMAGLFGSTALALDTMGPPSSGLKKGQFSAGADYSYTNMDIELDDGRIVEKIFQFGSLASVTSTEIGSFTVKNLKMHKVYANIGYGIADNWETFLRLGGMNADFSGNLFSTTSSESKDYDGDTGFAIGFGAKTTLYQQDKLKLGGLFQTSWASSEATLGPANSQESVELDIVEMQIAAGPSYNLTENITIYGGPFWHFISFGDSTIEGKKVISESSTGEVAISKATYEIDDNHYFGGYIGIDAEITKSVFYCIEYQHTVSSDALDMSIKYKF